MLKTKTLIVEIKTAFSNVPYPGDSKLVDHSCWECDEIAAQFKGKSWKELLKYSTTWLDRDTAFVSLLSPDAYHYFMPLCLIASLSLGDSLLTQSIIFSFTGPRYSFPSNEKLQERLRNKKTPILLGPSSGHFKDIDPKDIEWYFSAEIFHQNRMRLFSFRQLKAVLAYLEYMSERKFDKDISWTIRNIKEKIHKRSKK